MSYFRSGRSLMAAPYRISAAIQPERIGANRCCRLYQRIPGWLREEPQPDIDIRPTQVFTEYVRYHMTHDGKPVDGIRYRSSFNHRDHYVDRGCYVLFFEQDECLPGKSDNRLGAT